MLIVESQVHVWSANAPKRRGAARTHPQREIPLA